MSRFYGTVRGNRGDAHRGGSKDSGMTTQCASWEGCVDARVRFDEKNDRDTVCFGFSTWSGRGTNWEVYSGAIDPREDNEAVLMMVLRSLNLYLFLKDVDENERKKISAQVEAILKKRVLLEAL